MAVPPRVAHTSLQAYFQVQSRPAREIAVVWRKGYRIERWSYGTLFATGCRFARELELRGIEPGSRVLIWAENSGEWLAVFIGCLLRGAVSVPLDAGSSPEFARKVAADAGVMLSLCDDAFKPHLSGEVLDLNGLTEVLARHSGDPYHGPNAQRDDPVEIVFTSGTTSEPRGVVLTHGNVLSNLEPIEREIKKYRRLERFFHPLRFLNLLPLSHVFGQMLGIFIPQVLGATSIFLDSARPGDIIKTIHDEKVAVLISVPRVIDALQNQVETNLKSAGRYDKFQRNFERAEGKHYLRRWLIFQKIRSHFGWRFLALISGGAALSRQSEEFWGRLGYALIQGYGMTETTSLISVNHPFRLGAGSVGKAIPGVELKLDPNGEILVRGSNVAKSYWRGGKMQSAVEEDGWLHTGDLGTVDAEGNIFYRGREKNMIVNREGMNIFPADLEAVLKKDSRVRDCVVIGLDVRGDGNAEPCAVLLLKGGEGEDAAHSVVREANKQLAVHQQIRRWFVWPDLDLPRTSTQKPLLREIQSRVERDLLAESGAMPTGNAAAPAGIANLIAQVTGRPGASPSDLSSMERVELMSLVEDRYNLQLNETLFTNAATTQDLQKLVEHAPPVTRRFPFPTWQLTWPIRLIRLVVYYSLAWPATMILAGPTFGGREKLRVSPGPVIIACNHVTYLDAGFVLAALPARLRHHLVTSMDGEQLASMRRPEKGTAFWRGLLERLKYFLVVALFNVFPLPRVSGFRESFTFAGKLASRGESILIFPEGELTKTGETGRFLPGVGLLAANLQIPVVPMRVDGLYKLRLKRQRLAPRGTVFVSIGEPVQFRPEQSPEEISQQLKASIEALRATPKA
jgi:long-chain acyl-CoA synthetase